MGGNVLSCVSFNINMHGRREDEPHVCDCKATRSGRGLQNQRRYHRLTGRESENGVVHLLDYPFDTVKTTPPTVQDLEY